MTRTPTDLRAAGSGQLALGIDLGGTKIELALVDDAGAIRARRRVETEADAGADRVIEDIAKAGKELVDEAGGAGSSELSSGGALAAVGAGVAGQVDSHAGIVRTTPNLHGWDDVPLADRLERAFGVPAAITNDLNAITLGEQAYGAGKGYDDLVVVFVGTGVGGGVITGGRLVEGAGGYGGEIGHTTLVADGRQCTCRSRGCLEAYVGGWAIAARAQDAARKNAAREDEEGGRELVRLAGSIDQITAATVDRAATAGDPLARRLVEETGRLLGFGLVGVIHTFNPRRLVLGGGVIDGMPDLVPAATAVIEESVMTVFLEDFDIAPAALGGDAGVIGAARWARIRGADRPEKGKEESEGT